MKLSLLASFLLMVVVHPLAAEYAPKTWSQDIKNLNRLHNPVLLDIPVMNYTGINYYTMKYWPKGTVGLLQPLNNVRFNRIEPAAGAAESREVRGLSLYKVMNNMGMSQSVLEDRP